MFSIKFFYLDFTPKIVWTGFLLFSAFRNTAGLSVIWFQDHIFFFFGPTGQYTWRPLATTPERLTVWQSAGKHQFNEARLWLPLNARRLLSCWDGESETGQLTGSAPSIHQWLSHQINGLRVVRATKLLSSELQRSAELYTESKVERRDR